MAVGLQTCILRRGLGQPSHPRVMLELRAPKAQARGYAAAVWFRVFSGFRGLFPKPSTPRRRMRSQNHLLVGRKGLAIRISLRKSGALMGRLRRQGNPSSLDPKPKPLKPELET